MSKHHPPTQCVNCAWWHDLCYQCLTQASPCPTCTSLMDQFSARDWERWYALAEVALSQPYQLDRTLIALEATA